MVWTGTLKGINKTINQFNKKIDRSGEKIKKLKKDRKAEKARRKKMIKTVEDLSNQRDEMMSPEGLDLRK